MSTRGVRHGREIHGTASERGIDTRAEVGARRKRDVDLPSRVAGSLAGSARDAPGDDGLPVGRLLRSACGQQREEGDGAPTAGTEASVWEPWPPGEAIELAVDERFVESESQVVHTRRGDRVARCDTLLSAARSGAWHVVATTFLGRSRALASRRRSPARVVCVDYGPRSVRPARVHRPMVPPARVASVTSVQLAEGAPPQ